MSDHAARLFAGAGGRSTILALTALPCLFACSAKAEAAAPRYDSSFWRAWGDGQAEIDGYALTRDRYGERRSGTAVAIFVTEPWSTTDHVKADEPSKRGDVIQALKLNLVEAFQTGVYDYRLMTSAWTALEPAGGRPAGAAAKVSFSSQEWCGTTYSELIFDARGAHELVRSYFDKESGSRSLSGPTPGTPVLVEDLLLVWARGLASPLVPPGGAMEVSFLPSQARARLLHKPSAWTNARLTRERERVIVDVPAGRFTAERVAIETEGRRVELFVEVEPPRRVVRLASSDGTVLELTGTVRTPYWQKNHEGDEALLAQIGLRPPRAR